MELYCQNNSKNDFADENKLQNISGSYVFIVT